MSEEKFIIYGCGKRGKYFFELLRDKLDFVGFIDRNPDYEYCLKYNVAGLTLDEYLQSKNTATIIISVKANKEIIAALKRAGVDNYLFIEEIHGLYTYAPNYVKRENITPRNLIDNAVLDALSETVKKFYYRLLLNGERKFTSPLPLGIKHPLFIETYAPAIPAHRVLFGDRLRVYEGNFEFGDADAVLIHGLSAVYVDVVLAAASAGIPLILTEEGFIRSIVPSDDARAALKYRAGHALIFDEGGLYLNASSPSVIESLLNSEWEMTPREKTRAEGLMDFIIKHRLSKYNCQPIKENFSVGRANAPKVLIIDQSYQDKSITLGMASENTFNEMLKAALSENPDADVIIKSHPSGNIYGTGYFSQVTNSGRVYLLTEPINPISLLQQVDKVYVCTSQMGFEAMMCGKETHVFGMPFYAGWGASKDRQKCPRRVKKRSVAEIFFAAYVMCTTYVSYETNAVCEIEQAIDELLQLREEFMGNSPC